MYPHRDQSNISENACQGFLPGGGLSTLPFGRYYALTNLDRHRELGYAALFPLCLGKSGNLENNFPFNSSSHEPFADWASLLASLGEQRSAGCTCKKNNTDVR
jgi:hypothetical protein